MDMFHQINAAAGLAFSVAARVKRCHKRILEGLRQRIASRIPAEKHLGTGIPAVREVVLVDAQKQSVSLTIRTRSFRSEAFFWAMVSPFVYTAVSSVRIIRVS